jgi:phosphate uptake regulator
MSDNVQSMMFEILKSIQTDSSDLKVRMSAMEDLMRKQRRDTAGILVLMKGAVGEFDQRVFSLEQRVTIIEMNKEAP